MTGIDFIREVETNYDVASVTVNGVQVWPFLRQVYFSTFKGWSLAGASNRNKNMAAELCRAANMFRGMTQWFRRHEYVLLTSTLRRRLSDGNYIDKDAECLLDELGKQDALVILNGEAPGGRDFGRMARRATEENIVPCDPFNLLAILRTGRLTGARNIETLDEIQEAYGLHVNYRWIIPAFFRVARAFQRLYTVWRPKVVFVSGYYGIVHQAAIYAAWMRGIRTAELQHGLVNRGHEAYNVFCEVDRACFPDYLLVFGERMKEVFSGGNHFIDPDRVLPVGSGYIEHIQQTYRGSPALDRAIESHRLSVCVTSSVRFNDKLLAFIKAVAALDTSILYVFVPKNYEARLPGTDFPPNVKVFDDLQFYHIVGSTDFHLTVNSTCAIEAPLFGTPSILVDIDGVARSDYGSILTDPQTALFVETPEELVETLDTWRVPSREVVRARHTGFYSLDHRSRLREAMQVILG